MAEEKKKTSLFRNWRKSIRSLLTLEELRQRHDISVIIASILIFFTIGIAITCYFTNCSCATPIMWEFACFATGAAIGFLFGVPRVDDSKTPSSQLSPSLAAVSGRLKTNTNIEQISDWLTKIVVGVTLVQLTQLPGFIRHMAHVFATDGCSGKCTENFAIALIVYFVALGLAAGYLLTRTYLTLVFYRADDPGSSHAVSILQAELTDEEYMAIDAKKLGFEDDGFSTPHANITNPTLKKATDKISTLPLDEINDAKVLRLWAKAMIGNDKYDQAVIALEKAISQSGGETAEDYYEYAIALFFADTNQDESAPIPGSVHDALKNAYKRLQTCDDLSIHRGVYIGLGFYALYVPAPGGFEEAIQYGEEYIDKYDKVLPSARIYFYLAAAYGQKATYYNTITKDDEVRVKALDYAKKAIGRDAGTYLPLLQSLVNPSKDEPNDNDLQVFNSDHEFLKALSDFRLRRQARRVSTN